MAGAQISCCAGLNPGSVYTMSISVGGILGTIVGTTASQIQSTLNGCAGVDIASNISVNESISPLAWGVTFTYTGDGSDSATDVFQEFANALEGLGYSWNYGGTSAGTSGPATGCQIIAKTGAAATAVGNAASTAAMTLNNVANSPSSLWAIAVIGLIAIFVLSGGVGAARSLSEAA